MRPRRLLISAFLTLALHSSAGPPDPAALLGQARERIAKRQYVAALEILDDALASAATIEPAEQKRKATAAIRFFSAVAAHGAGKDDRARQDLVEFFTLMPEAAALDSHMYDRKFVRLFSDVQKSVQRSAQSRFNLLYPGFDGSDSWDPPREPPDHWSTSVERALLATAEEQTAWETLPDNEREAFVERFWSSRDPTPGDGDNELRRELGRRRVFADETFATADTRGALTDRGRVFVLLGPPQAVDVRPLTAGEGGSARERRPETAPAASSSSPSMQDTMGSFRAMDAERRATPGTTPVQGGLVEVWFYGRDALPSTIRTDKVEFKFITEKGYGDHVLQREPFVIKALEDAARLTMR